MIRIFITTIIYLIGLLTQAKQISDKQSVMSSSGYMVGIELKSTEGNNAAVNFETQRFYEAEFELRDKDLTFEIKL